MAIAISGSVARWWAHGSDVEGCYNDTSDARAATLPDLGCRRSSPSTNKPVTEKLIESAKVRGPIRIWWLGPLVSEKEGGDIGDIKEGWECYHVDEGLGVFADTCALIEKFESGLEARRARTKGLLYRVHGRFATR
ncbi:hypothetical protein C1H46_044582 [Malus baccata]|uniref:Uncharacterized protein n=1 Tax=Malus baccata TaxID=106549 RepID=A0A540K6N6_MALBA|nr:hypothetical protein C1H46_044582 [Malus baccata]